MAGLIEEVRACTLCAPYLPLGPRPVFQWHRQARILIAGQAPGRKVHTTGIPFDDPSGDRLRNWLGVDRAQFYDARQFALLPMGFCYPGTGKSGDLPPRPECADRWRQSLMAGLNRLELTLALGSYAQDWHFAGPSRSVTSLARTWQEHWPEKLALPHPSPRNNLWLRRNPWFESEVVPMLRTRVAEILSREDGSSTG